MQASSPYGHRESLGRMRRTLQRNSSGPGQQSARVPSQTAHWSNSMRQFLNPAPPTASPLLFSLPEPILLFWPHPSFLLSGAKQPHSTPLHAASQKGTCSEVGRRLSAAAHGRDALLTRATQLQVAPAAADKRRTKERGRTKKRSGSETSQATEDAGQELTSKSCLLRRRQRQQRCDLEAKCQNNHVRFPS